MGTLESVSSKYRLGYFLETLSTLQARKYESTYKENISVFFPVRGCCDIIFQITKMSPADYVLLLLLFLSQLALCSGQDSSQRENCSFICGRLGVMGYPFFRIGRRSCSSLIAMNCTASVPKAQFLEKGKWYRVNNFNYSLGRMEIHDEDLQSHLESNRCDFLGNFSEQTYLSSFNQEWPPLFLSFNITEPRPIFKCKRKSNLPSTFFNHFDHYNCTDYDLYYYKNQEKHLPFLPANLSDSCSVVQLPSARDPDYDTGRVKDQLTKHWTANFTIVWKVLQACADCYGEGGVCQRPLNQSVQCYKKDQSAKKGDNVGRKIAIGLGTGFGSILLTCIAFIFYIRRKENRLSSSSALISRDLIHDNSFKLELEKGTILFQTQIFTYKELNEATNNFDSKNELGGGGFGTVYCGKLRDGRIVAVKRLFEHNCKRVEQFMNEVAILSRLRHKNLVPLYGCTTHHDHELLIVYEFVPNGTLGDHIHGKRIEDGLLTWPIRMSIAVESADALAYLHASEIIHRDVKSSNILLDNNFHVKVADFGLSRFFPTDVTHVSTAPQGTPGYVDPEYHQYYQLNNKSDVYSFGVVLIELISSKPAVDIARNRHEINLANMAISRIHNQALHELVDPSLGYDTDYNVRNMITQVAELAFRCLQQDNEMRPSMKEVLEILQGIENGADDMDTSDVVQLLKNDEPLSSDTVTGKWPSEDTTPNTSG